MRAGGARLWLGTADKYGLTTPQEDTGDGLPKNKRR